MLALTDVEAKATDIIARRFKKHPGPLDLDTRLREDLGADSLDLVDLVFELEQEPGVSIPDADAAEIRTIGDAVRYLERALSWSPLAGRSPTRGSRPVSSQVLLRKLSQGCRNGRVGRPHLRDARSVHGPRPRP